MASSHPPTEVPDRLPVELVPKPPTLRFIYRPITKRANQLISIPYGYATFEVTEEDLDAGAVVGEIRAIDDEHAVVYFVCGADADREAARPHLQEWAQNDKWQLEFAEGTHALSEPDPPVETHWTPGICASCREALGTGVASHMRVNSVGWMRTTCPCGGRMRWYKRPRRRATGKVADR